MFVCMYVSLFSWNSQAVTISSLTLTHVGTLKCLSECNWEEQLRNRQPRTKWIPIFPPVPPPSKPISRVIVNEASPSSWWIRRMWFEGGPHIHPPTLPEMGGEKTNQKYWEEESAHYHSRYDHVILLWRGMPTMSPTPDVNVTSTICR